MSGAFLSFNVFFFNIYYVCIHKDEVLVGCVIKLQLNLRYSKLSECFYELFHFIVNVQLNTMLFVEEAET